LSKERREGGCKFPHTLPNQEVGGGLHHCGKIEGKVWMLIRLNLFCLHSLGLRTVGIIIEGQEFPAVWKNSTWEVVEAGGITGTN
jgi:hypothetical protein